MDGRRQVFKGVQCKSAHQLTCSAVVSGSLLRHNVCGLQLLGHCHIEQWSCIFIPPYTFMVWCLLTDRHLSCYVAIRMCKDVDWIYLAYSGLQCQGYVNVVVNTDFL